MIAVRTSPASDADFSILQREADAARNRGVTWQAQLQAVPLDAAANTRGIRRAADKVV